MKRSLALFLAGFLAGGGLVYWILSSGRFPLPVRGTVEPESTPVCHSCFWEDYDPALQAQVVDFYSQYRNPDLFVQGDVHYILWRLTEKRNCDARNFYRRAAGSGAEPERTLQAWAAYALSGPECGWDGRSSLREAAKAAEAAGRRGTANLLRQLSERRLRPALKEQEINTTLRVPAGAKWMILGESVIELNPGMRVGAQVDRVVRDWISYQLRWDLTGKPVEPGALLNYHEGRLAKEIQSHSLAEVYPLGGTLAARLGQEWFAPDETGTFRFKVVDDKLQYPTTHAAGNFAWMVDTHGVSAIVEQAVAGKMQVVVGCGDSEGKAQAALYLASKGIHVVMPGDRYQYLLLGYEAPGVILGTAPLKLVDGRAIIGGQPVRISLDEPIVVEDTRANFPTQYYDAPARYFSRLRMYTPLKVEYVRVDNANQLGRVLTRAAELKASVVAVRVVTNAEYTQLRDWLRQSPTRRAILFHSGLYPHAQTLFTEFPKQVTFGDLHPRFE